MFIVIYIVYLSAGLFSAALSSFVKAARGILLAELALVFIFYYSFKCLTVNFSISILLSQEVEWLGV